MKFAAYMAFSFITFFHVPLVPFLSLYMWLYVLYAFVTPRHFISHIMSCYIISCHVRYHIIYHIMSYIISCHVIYHIISYHIISYHIISYHIISYHIISYH